MITLFSSLFFSTKAVIVKYAFNNSKVDAVSLLTIRMLFSLPFYVVSAWIVNNKNDNTKLSSKQWLYIVMLGLLGYYLSSLFDFLGLQYVSAGLERLVLFLYPTFAVLINATVFKEKISRMQGIALALTYAGIVIAYIGELSIDTGSPHFFLGSLFILICSVTYAIFMVGSGRLVPLVGVTKFTTYVMLASTAGVFIHFVIAGKYDVIRHVSGFVWYGLLLAVVATVIPSFMFAAGMKKIGSNNVVIISSIGPVSTIIQAHFILGEPILAAQIVGTIMVIAGVVLIGWRFQRNTG